MDFDTQVLELSDSTPVLVDFWAPWCGPCQVLGPILDAVAEEHEDFKLVKVNTEEEREVATTYQIRSIPNVKLFHKREVVAEFAGALTKVQLEKWLDENLPTAEKESWKEVEQKMELLQQSEQLDLVNSFLKNHPTHEHAQIALARLFAFSQVEEAMELTKDIREGQPQYSLRQDIEALHQLSLIDVESGSEIEELLRSSRTNLENGNFADAATGIISALQKDRSYKEDLPRRAGIAIFRLLGSKHPVTREYRKLFDMAIY